MTATTTESQPTLADLPTAAVADSYARRGLHTLSDARLCDLVAGALGRPKVAPADSFVLHAPLELLARRALLPLVEPEWRDLARQRLVWLASAYAEAGEELPAPASVSFDRRETAVAQLSAAIDAGDLDQVDRLACWVGDAFTPIELNRALAAEVLPRLSAAAHGSIFLYLLPRVAPRSAAATRLVRGLVRELAREPDWNLTWHRTRHRIPLAPTAGDLTERLRRPASPGDPGSNFIFPTMSLVDRSGLAASLLNDPTQSLDVAQATRELLRVAAWSMLQDDPNHAPYGWTHCLTMPQAVLGVAGVAGIPESGADPQDAVAVAATYVLGFRSTLGAVTLNPAWVPDQTAAGASLEALTASPAEAAVAAWHAPDDAVAAIVARLATKAAIHPDAHLAKYTLACLDAASSDPAAGRLYLAAAAYLGAWWGQQPVGDDPLLP